MAAIIIGNLITFGIIYLVLDIINTRETDKYLKYDPNNPENDCYF